MDPDDLAGLEQEWEALEPHEVPGTYAHAQVEIMCVATSADLLRMCEKAPLRGEALRLTLTNLTAAVNVLVAQRAEQEAADLSRMRELLRTCVRCQRRVEDAAKLCELRACGHRVCRACAYEFFLQHRSCPSPHCGAAVEVADAEAFLEPEQLAAVVDSSVRAACGELVRCATCGMDIQVDAHGEGPDASRVRCSCGSTLCGQCGVAPFHAGISCEEFRSTAGCRFCGTRVSHPEGDAALVACEAAACRARADKLCLKALPCGHACGGYAGELLCPAACLFCTRRGEACALCLEPLMSDACVVLECAHVFHRQCVLARLQLAMEPRGRVDLGGMDCALCKHPVGHLNAFKLELARLGEVRARVTAIVSAERAKLPASEAAALVDGSFAVYWCSRCSQPFFGGLENCERALDQAEARKDEELLCNSCTCVALQVPQCEAHGADMLVFKCRFCCSVSRFFCWGTTHFCESCHDKQENRAGLNHKKPSDLPQCGGAAACPLGVDHPPNGSGDKFILGCALCMRGLSGDY